MTVPTQLITSVRAEPTASIKVVAVACRIPPFRKNLIWLIYLTMPEVTQDPIDQVDQDTVSNRNDNHTGVKNILLRTITGSPGMVNDLSDEIVHPITSGEQGYESHREQ